MLLPHWSPHQDFTIQDIPEEQEKETNDNNENIAVTPSNQSIQIYEKLESMMNEQQTYLKNDLLLNDVAKQLGTNRTYLLAALNSCAHMTFKEYINRKRIAHAEQLMAQNPLTPKTEIATLSGYTQNRDSHTLRLQQHVVLLPQLQSISLIRKHPVKVVGAEIAYLQDDIGDL